jgi:hypothetical protein
MYDNYNDAMDGFSKNVVEFFGNSFIAAMLFWFISLTGIIWTAIFLPAWLTIIYIIIIICTRILISIISRQDITDNITMHFVQIYNLGLLIFKSITHKINKSYQWKGRNIT